MQGFRFDGRRGQAATKYSPAAGDVARALGLRRDGAILAMAGVARRRRRPCCRDPVPGGPPSRTRRAGADDQPGQKDLTLQARRDERSRDLWTMWQWDDTSLSGKNTFDACSLFDTDGDLKVNYAVCVTVENTTTKPATLIERPAARACTPAGTARPIAARPRRARVAGQTQLRHQPHCRRPLPEEPAEGHAGLLPHRAGRLRCRRRPEGRPREHLLVPVVVADVGPVGLRVHPARRVPDDQEDRDACKSTTFKFTNSIGATVACDITIDAGDAATRHLRADADPVGHELQRHRNRARQLGGLGTPSCTGASNPGTSTRAVARSAASARRPTARSSARSSTTSRPERSDHEGALRR